MRPALIALLLLAGCSATDPAGVILTVVNWTPGELVVFAYPGPTLIHPVPTLDASDFPDHRVAPGSSLEVDEIPGYEAGTEIALFIYSVGPGNVADFSQFRSIPPAELRGGRRIVLRDVPAPLGLP